MTGTVASLPPEPWSLPPLGGRLLIAYRLACALLLAAALGVLALTFIQPGTHTAIWTLRLVKAVVLVTVSAILFRRRRRDPVAAMLSLSFLLWTISSSVDFAGSTDLIWPALLDRSRFLLFALALILFPDGQWVPRWTQPVAAGVIITFLIGIGETLGLLTTHAFLPLAIGCVLLAIAALLGRFRLRASDAQKQQLKWVALGLVIGVSLILSARAGNALTAHMEMPLVGDVVLEGLFQLGIVVIALGFLTSLLRYRLYDAEAAISRSAVYAGLTLALVAIFAASEALIELLGQRYFGAAVGNLSGAMAAAVAAVLLTPLHGRISGWAEQHFQRDLIVLKQELPGILNELSVSSSVATIGAAVLPRIEEAVHSARIALSVDGAIVAARGISKSSARRWAKKRAAPASIDLFDSDDDREFPLRMALRCPFGKVRGWLLLGPRPDGSFYGKDDLDALTVIAPPLRHVIFSVLAREKDRQSVEARVEQLAAKIIELETAVQAGARLSGEPDRQG